MEKTFLNSDSLSEALKADLKKYALQHGISEYQVVEKAVAFFLEAEKRRQFIAGLKLYGHDKENIEIAEWGMDDYSEQLKKYRN